MTEPEPKPETDRPGAVLQLVQKARRQSKPAGLDGDDPVSRLLDVLLALSAMLAVRRELPAAKDGASDWTTPALYALFLALAIAIVASFFVGQKMGWEQRDAAMWRACANSTQPYQGGRICVYWLVPPKQ